MQLCLGLRRWRQYDRDLGGRCIAYGAMAGGDCRSLAPDEMSVQQQSQNETEQQAGQESDSEGLVFGQTRVLPAGFSQVDLAVLAPGRSGHDRFQTEGALLELFGD